MKVALEWSGGGIEKERVAREGKERRAVTHAMQSEYACMRNHKQNLYKKNKENGVSDGPADLWSFGEERACE